MLGSVTTLKGLHVTGKYKNISMHHICFRHAAWDPNTKHAPWDHHSEKGGQLRRPAFREGMISISTPNFGNWSQGQFAWGGMGWAQF